MTKKIECNYRDNAKLRLSFNELANKVFGLSFEEWYKNGFWKENYNPYSIITDCKVISNISVNKCNVNYNGKIVKLIQLGTVMTDPDYRGKGYSREIMEQILIDYKDKVDGIYLFANDSVTSFYPKFGFREYKEYRYSKNISVNTEKSVIKIPMNNKNDWHKMVKIINKKEQNSKMYMVDNTGLYMFYLSQFMKENVFYLKDDDTYIVAEEDGDTLIIHAIFGDCSIDNVIKSFGREIKKVILCFTPKNPEYFEIQELKKEDTTLFVIGKFFDDIADDKIIFQEITHA